MERTNRDMFRQIEELIIENEQLKAENIKLKAENRRLLTENERLRNRIEVLENSIDERISQAVKLAVSKATEPLLAIIAEKDKEILRLKAQINKDSSNSSKPTGSNGFKKVPNNREKSERKHGGQNGHKGVRLNIPENLDDLVASGMAEHVIISDVAEGEPYVSDWTVDLKIVTVYTEHRRQVGTPPQIKYGTQLKTLSVYLNVIGLVAYKRLSQFFHEISNDLITVSKAALAEFNHSTANDINISKYVEDILNGKVIGVDETPIKTSERPNTEGVLETAKKTTFNAYIRTYSNDLTTVLTGNSYKTEESVVTDNILTRFHGIISQDHESKFYKFGDRHATCGAHLTRELRGMLERQMLSWAGEVREFFLGMNKYKNEDVRNKVTVCDPIVLSGFEARYDELLEKGKGCLEATPAKTFGHDELRRMVNRLEKHKDNYLLFIRNYEAPFTNNQAERDLRHCKTKQKVSGCFRSWQGVLDYCKIRSLLDTAKKRGKNLFLALLAISSKPSPAGQ